MKKPLSFLFILLFSTSLTHQAVAQKQDISTKAIYFELLGAGGPYSFNFDTRFQNRLDGLGGRIGVSYLAADGSSIFSIPVMMNYLLGKDGNYFEIGLGATYINFSDDEDRSNSDEFLFVDGSGLFGTMTFGYRLQPEDGGFLFRVGLNPVFGNGNFTPYWPYLSFGYSF